MRIFMGEKMIRWFFALAVLFASPAYAADFSVAEGHFSATYGVTFAVDGQGAQRQASGFAASNRQGVRLFGPADAYSSAEAQVDWRPANQADSKAFLITVVRSLVPEKAWADAEAFVSNGLGDLKPGGKTTRKAGGRALELQRISDVMIKLTVK